MIDASAAAKVARAISNPRYQAANMRWSRSYIEEDGCVPPSLGATVRRVRMRWAERLVASVVQPEPPEPLQARLRVLSSAAVELQIGWRLDGVELAD
jgi:hypothetical protein